MLVTRNFGAFIWSFRAYIATSCISNIDHSRVTEVAAKDLCIMDKATKVTKRVPYGICVWSTGVAPVPITKTIMERIPAQGKG